MPKDILDIFVIGGGVNGVAIARDAAGRGYRVVLSEQDDLASKTSSNSTKLFHGGLRYMEYLDISLVREGLRERYILLNNMPHIAWPLRFVLPLDMDLRITNNSPVSKLLKITMPWLKGRRPIWIIRLGLFFYDILAGSFALESTKKLNLDSVEEGVPLKNKFKKAYEYSDVWVDDARLVSLMARDAKERGAQILTRNKVLSFKRKKRYWKIKTLHGIFKSRILINAAGPWTQKMAQGFACAKNAPELRLVKGSHIVTRKLYDHGKAYFFMGEDGRIMFSLPFQKHYTVIGTTETLINNEDDVPICSPEEINYICKFASEYFEQPITEKDIVWKYSGIRPLFEDKSDTTTGLSRDYFFTLNDDHGQMPLLNVFGGKLTTHRALAEKALKKIESYLGLRTSWTHSAKLPGGDFNIEDRSDLVAKLGKDYEFLKEQTVERLFRNYGLDSWAILGSSKSFRDLGENFGSDLYAKEIEFLVKNEFVQFAEDILWRRTKLGLVINEKKAHRIDSYIQRILQQDATRL